MSAGDPAYASASGYRGDGGWSEIAATPTRFQWESRDPRVADVTARGLVRARSPGVAWIVVTTDGVRDSSRVAVSPPVPVTVVLLPPPPYVLSVGDTVPLRVRVHDPRTSEPGLAATLEPWGPAIACEPIIGARSTRTFILDADYTAKRGYTEVVSWRLIARAEGQGELTWAAYGRSGVVPVTVVRGKER